MFLDPLPAFGRNVDCGGTAKPTAMEIPTLWKMPTTKTRSRLFRQSLISNPIGYDLEISTRLFQLGRGRRILLGIKWQLIAFVADSEV
jgi:hypothetical protein